MIYMNAKLMFLAAAIYGAAPAWANLQSSGTDYFFPNRTVGQWTIYGMSNDCWMYQNYADGTRLSFSRGAKNDLYLSASNARWQSLRDRAKYDLTVTLGDRSFVEDATAYVDPGSSPSIVFFFDDPVSNYNALKTSRSIFLARGVKSVGTYSLTGASVALQVFEQCVARIGSSDPFAQ